MPVPRLRSAIRGRTVEKGNAAWGALRETRTSISDSVGVDDSSISEFVVWKCLHHLCRLELEFWWSWVGRVTQST